jgi:predicted TIM-barrel fold metal-dependent hydrolase
VTVLTGEEVARLALVDQHCHPVAAGPLDDATFEMWCTESQASPPSGVSYLDSHLGHAIRRWCAPALGLPAHSSMMDYLTTRRELSPVEVNKRLLRHANLRCLLVDTGLPSGGLLTQVDLAEAAGAPTAEVVRLETLADRVADTTTASRFADEFTSALARALTGGAVAVKSILAYRYGLDIQPERPTPAEVVAAAGRWLRDRERQAGQGRLADPVLLRFLLWSAVDAGRPIQVHTGFGDADAAVRLSDPALLQPFCAATEAAGTPIVLLHCYPYHRQAGWLAHLYPHVYVDLGLTISYLGARSTVVLGEFLELAPFGKVLYSSDAYGLAELFLVGAAQFRHSLAVVLAGFVADGAMTVADTYRIASAVSAGNAVRLYRLPAG